MSEVTDLQRQTFREMQARLIALLLRHSEPCFRHYFGERDWNQEVQEDARFRPYRELAVFFQLRDELFEHILPRIVRRLSFEAPRQVMVEEPPARGRVDWERTLSATWEERPGEAPLQVHTRQRRRHFATPQNLLTVATLLEYHDDAQRLLWDEQAPIGGQRLRHPLNEIMERCERELGKSQFAGLRASTQQIVERQEVSSLEAQVSERIMPGGNSAYQELLEWRRRRRELRLLKHDAQRDLDETVGADPNRDNYLYQLWIFYELVDFLSDQDCLDDFTVDPGKTHLQFHWGSGDNRCGYELRHDQHVPQQPARWTVTPQDGKDAVPGVRPDFYLRRIDPPMEQVEYKGTVYWREPGVVWDAKYYRDRERETTPSTPLKRMVADLNLLGEEYGALLFAFLKSDEGQSILVLERSVVSEETDTLTTNLPSPFSRFTPLPGNDQTLIPNQQVTSWQVQPQGVSRIASVRSVLTTLLDDAHKHLAQPRTPQCYGMFLDTLSANAHGQMAATMGLTWRNQQPVAEESLEQFLLCPKPHIGSWRVDLVSADHHCGKDPTMCHIMNRPGITLPQRLTSLREITSAIGQAQDQGDPEVVARAAQKQVRIIVQRYAELMQPDIASYRVWIKERLEIDELFDTTPWLNEAHRETLALGRFLWEQIEHIKATNFAGPVLLFTGVLEEIIRVTIYKASPKLCDSSGKPLLDTLGTLGNCKEHGGTNWVILDKAIMDGGHWNSQLADGANYSFSTFIDVIQKVAYIRNDAAHRARVETKSFQKLVTYYFGSALSGVGLLNGLLLAWQP